MGRAVKLDARTIVDSRQWFRVDDRRRAIEGLESVWRAEDTMNIPKGQPGNVDADVAALAKKLGMRPALLGSVLLQGLIELGNPKDGFHFEMLADK